MRTKTAETKPKKIKLTLTFIYIATSSIIIDLNRRDTTFTLWHGRI